MFTASHHPAPHAAQPCVKCPDTAPQLRFYLTLCQSVSLHFTTKGLRDVSLLDEQLFLMQCWVCLELLVPGTLGHWSKEHSPSDSETDLEPC